MKKLTNDENIKNLRLRRLLRIIIIISGLATIILALLSLIIKISVWYAIGTMLVTTLLTRYRESISINKSDELLEIEKEIKKKKNNKIKR